MEKAIANAVALSTTQAEQIFAIREWAGNRAVAASAKKDVQDYQMVLPGDESKNTEDNLSKIGKARGGRFVDF